MDSDRSDLSGYVIVALLGAAMGGMMVAWVTNAFPRMMKRMMAGIMENMRAQMSAEGCKTEEI